MLAFSVPLVSYASSSPTLSSKFTFPYFFRTCPSDDEQTQVWISLMQHYGWQQCAVLASNDAYGTGVASAFVNSTTDANINVKVVGYFSPTSSDFSSQLSSIRHSGAKIIILAAIAGQGGRLCLKQAATMGMLGQGTGFLWIIAEGTASFPLLISDAYTGEWPITNAQFEQALFGNIGTRPQGGSGPLWDLALSTWVNGSLNPALFPGAGSASVVETDIYVPYAFDAVYTVAHAYLALAQNGDDATNGTLLREALANTDFVGVTGRIQFDENFDRNAPYAIMNMQNVPNLFKEVGIWTFFDGVIELSITSPIIWPGGSLTAPGDGLPHTLYWIQWSSVVSIVLVILAGLAILLMTATGAIVFWYADTPIMRLASPVFLTITLAGLSMMYSSIIPWMGEPSTASCTIKLWLGFVGFVAALSAIIVKTYRVYVIFSHKRKVKKIIVTNLQLVKYVGVLVAPLIILLIVWTAVDLPHPTNTLDFTNVRVDVMCASKSNAWLIACIVYCALMMLVSLALSFRTRHVPDGFNETWYVYLSGYNTIIMGIVGVTVGYILSTSPLAVTVIVSVTILFGGLVLWGLLFLPKLYVCIIAPERNTMTLQQVRMRPKSRSSWASEGTSEPDESVGVVNSKERSSDEIQSESRRSRTSIVRNRPASGEGGTTGNTGATTGTALTDTGASSSRKHSSPVGSRPEEPAPDEAPSLHTHSKPGKDKNHHGANSSKPSDKLRTLSAPGSTHHISQPTTSAPRRRGSEHTSECSSSHGDPVEEMGAEELAEGDVPVFDESPGSDHPLTQVEGSKRSSSRTKDSERARSGHRRSASAEISREGLSKEEDSSNDSA